MPRTLAPFVLLLLGLTLSASGVDLPAAAQGKDTLAPKAKPQADAGAKDPADFPRAQGLVRTTYSQAAGKLRDEEIATYHAEAGMDEIAGTYLERLQTANWKKGSDEVSGTGATRLRIIQWTMPAKEAEVRFYAVKSGGTDVRVRLFTYKTTPAQTAVATTGATTPTNAKTSEGNSPPLSPVVTVPNLAGRPVAEAESLLGEAGLKAQTNPGKTMLDLQTPGTVAEQNPLPGQKVKRDSTVTLTPWSSLIAVYDVMGVPLAYAKSLLEYRRFRTQVGPAKQDLVGVGGRAKDGLVAEENPAAGQAVALDSTVTLIPWVSQVLVPDLSGLSLAQAASQLGANHLRYQVVSQKPDQVQPGASPKGGIVAVQNPGAGQTVALDSVVTLTPWVSLARVPNLTDQPLAQAESLLTALQFKFEIGSVKLARTGSAPKDGLVGEQSPQPGEWLNLGSTVTLNPWASQVSVPDLTGQSLAQAENLLTAQQFQYQVGPAMPDTSVTGPSPKEGLVAAQSPAAGQTAVRGSPVILTPWGTATRMINVTDLPLAQAENALTQHGFKYEVAPGKLIPATRSRLDDGHIAEQNPVLGLTVAQGSTVILTPWVAPVVVPDLTGQPLAQAENILTTQQFQYQVGPAKPDAAATGPSLKDGLVAAQSPAAGQTAVRGSPVTLTPWGTAARMINVTDRPLAEAENTLTQHGFKYQVAPGKLIPATRSRSDDGHIAEQDPVQGQTVAQGSTVILTPWVVPVVVPDLKYWPLAQAESALAGLGLQSQSGPVIQVQAQTSSMNMDGVVGVQSPAAGQTVTPGSVVTLQVFQSTAR